MKTTLIFATLILFAGLMGCSEDFNLTEPSNHIYNESAQQKNPGTSSEELVWKLDRLSVRAGGQSIVENKAIYTSLPLTEISSYRITFDAYTNADKFTNGYAALVKVTTDNESVFQSSVFPDIDGDGISQVEIKLSNVRFTELMFYVALFQADSVPAIDDHSAGEVNHNTGAVENDDSNSDAICSLKQIMVYKNR